jgi:HK97 family phage major capsid protein/HK97 family phage prohead protease
MKLTPQTRFVTMDSAPIVDIDQRKITFPFSSELPVQRWYGNEILAHDAESADLSRLNDGAPLLFNHEMNDVIGKVERAWINSTERRGYATVRFAKTARAEEVLGMVRDEILPNVSFMYRILDAVDNPKTGEIRVTKYEPLEISIVTVPADQSVGIGRAFVNEETEVRMTRIEAIPAPEGVAITAQARGATMSDAPVVNTAAPVVTDAQDKRTTVQLEEDRIAAIRNLSKAFDIPAAIERNWIVSGTDWNKIGAEALAYRETQKNAVQQSQAYIDLPTKDVKRYSMWRALDAVVSGDWSKAGLELEASRAVSARTGRANNRNGFFIPVDVQQRDMTVGTDSAGGYLRGTSNQSFIELLRNRMVAFQMGATRLSGLVGNVTIPKQTAGATAYWLSTEATAITEGNQTFGQLALTPRTVGAYTEISRLLQLQSSPDAEQLIMSDLAKQVAIAADLAVLAGTGTEQPTGIVGTAGIGGVTGTSIALAGMLEFQSDVAGNNALSASCGYLTTPVVASLLMARQRFTSTDTPLWEGNMLDGKVLGFKAMTSKQCPTGDIIFGDFSQVVVGEWGVLELAVNTAANFPAGITGIRAMYTMDVGVRYAGAFSLATSVT